MWGGVEFGGEGRVKGMRSCPLWWQGQVSSRVITGGLGMVEGSAENIVLCSGDIRLVRGCTWPRKKACPDSGQKMAQFPQRYHLSLCQVTQKEAACDIHQLPLEMTKWDSWPSKCPNSSF